jgi:TRAP-type C4-dicarboxylate transport system substrate-binding protein
MPTVRYAIGLAALVSIVAVGAAKAQHRGPTVLTMAVADVGGPSTPVVAFTYSVERLSKGRLLIAVRTPSQQTADGELRVLRDVEDGAVPMGQVPTRAWDAVGVPIFAPLQAPFLITNYTLLQKVLAGSIGRGMRNRTRAAGVRTLGLAAVDLHIPLGARRAFVTPADFQGARLRFPSNSSLTSAIMRALGGNAVSIASGPDLFTALQAGSVDGAVTSPGIVIQNGYSSVAKLLTLNVVFFPRIDSVAINEHAFEALSPADRRILEQAAVEMTKRGVKGLRARDELQLKFLCRTGLKVYTSTPAQRAALRRAVQPVYSALEHGPALARPIRQIEALKKRVKPPAPFKIPAGCAGS